ncbi:hypothetical protein JQ615_24820 [Bradyrhizobium jicamae]|uniref:Uncharacterized protein n=1 Tax=Bradyrhizobium jicamae TaxID=280332 RepID=A0ABS5FPC9_9BRAD|nr:hypothetical protein [Bradyrhizobium jicamae]MBR0798614.1 hypothetical protein [Bradyrhizobium jicamae]
MAHANNACGGTASGEYITADINALLVKLVLFQPPMYVVAAVVAVMVFAPLAVPK